MFGFFNIHKPPGCTSHDVVYKVRKRLPAGVKVGHCGTLDPFAEGVLVVCMGPATRLTSFVQDRPKRYLATITLGQTSTTADPEGEIIATPGATPPAAEAVQNALAAFRGQITQVPPAHSAVFINGQRAYDLARKGREVDMPTRSVRIDAMELVRYEWPILELDITCGGGTYIRAIARDLGEALGVGGYCSGLVRSEIGEFTLATAMDVRDVEARHLIAPLAAVSDMPRLTITEEQAHAISFGRRLRLTTAPLPPMDIEIAVVTEGGELIALAKIDPDGPVLRQHMVFRKEPT